MASSTTNRSSALAAAATLVRSLAVLGGLAAVILLGAVAFVYQRRVAAQRSPEQLAQSVTGASGGGADNKLSAVAVHLDLDSALTQPPNIPDEKPTTEGAAPPHIHIDP